MIQEGAGEDFLQWDFEAGRLGFLENMWDLKGLPVFQQRFEFPDGGDTFEAIDFSYAEFHHSQFINAVFNCHIDFARIYNCEFVNCVFCFNGCYATVLERCKFTNCEFFESNSFTNCVFKNVEFRNCFICERIFFECKFDETTEIDEPGVTTVRTRARGLRLEPTERAGIYRGIEEAFAAGEVISKARFYYFKKMQCLTRYNTSGKGMKSSGYILEYLTGYGVKPIRVFLVMLVVFFAATLWFSADLGFANALMLVAGAFLTFGAKSELIYDMGLASKLIYVLTAFSGIGLTALLVTVLASKWLRER
jgi:hypothetical protein